MTSQKQTKRALGMSALALLLCVAMLIGTTFAWFTDSTSTAVNRIEAGTLKVELWNEEGTAKLDGPLTWKKAADGADQVVLWEPGACYALEGFRIKSVGSLALKYRIAVTGLVGDSKLLDAIDFAVTGLDGAASAADLDGFEGVLLPDADHNMTEPITITGTMKTTVGNEYQGLSINGIAITVYATQYPYEYDSNTKDYDKDANMTPDNLDLMVSADVTVPVAEEGDTVLQNADKTVTLTAPAGSTEATDLTLKVTPKKQLNSSVNIEVLSYQTAKAYDISLTDGTDKVVAADGTAFTVNLFIGKGLQANGVTVYHHSEKIQAVYDSTTGFATFTVTEFSPFTVVYKTPAAVSGSGKDTSYYNSLADAVNDTQSGKTEITLLKDTTESRSSYFVDSKKEIVVNLNGHTVNFAYAKGLSVSQGTLTLTGKGTLQEIKPYYSPLTVAGLKDEICRPTINIGKDVTLKGWSGLFIDAPKTAKALSPVIHVDGTLIGVNDIDGDAGSGLYINGQNKNETDPVPEINLHETAVITGTGAGIYGAGYAVYHTCGSITGEKTGMELRAGKLYVTGGTIIGNGVPTEVKPDGNGATTVGAGIAVAQHNTKLTTELYVTGGVIKGYTALHQSNPQELDAEAVAKVKLAVSGGQFETINGGSNTVYSENCTSFITGGTFNVEPAAAYRAEG